MRVITGSIRGEGQGHYDYTALGWAPGAGEGMSPYSLCPSSQGLNLEPHPDQSEEPQLFLDLPGSGSDCPQPSAVCLQNVACSRMNGLENLLSCVPCFSQPSSVFIHLGLRGQRGGLSFLYAHQEIIPETLEDSKQLLLGQLKPQSSLVPT